MVAIKTHQASAFLNALDRVPQAVLFYGSDVGLVSERAAQLAKALAGRDDPPGEILRLDDSSLEDDPDRIFVELQTAPMFGGRKVVRAAAGETVVASVPVAARRFAHWADGGWQVEPGEYTLLAGSSVADTPVPTSTSGVVSRGSVVMLPPGRRPSPVRASSSLP